MKKILILAVASLLAFGSCDVIEPPYKKENIQLETDRKVLMEYYTGHKCPNCPKAAKTIHELSDIYGENLVVISIHTGTFAFPLPFEPFKYDFRTAMGAEWQEGLGVTVFPSGIVNRTERSGNMVISPANFGAVVAEMLNKETEAEINIIADYDTDLQKIGVTVTTNMASPKVGEKYYLTVVLTEDHISKAQENNDTLIGTTPVIYDYHHMHVLRAGLSNPWGTRINPTIIDSKAFEFTLPIDSDIVPKNCNIIAFISKSNREVLQAEEIRLIP